MSVNNSRSLKRGTPAERLAIHCVRGKVWHLEVRPHQPSVTKQQQLSRDSTENTAKVKNPDKQK